MNTARNRHQPGQLLDQPLLSFGKDQWTIRDACEGTAILGAPGSGKTSGSGFAIASACLRAGFGGLVLTAKKDEVNLWRRYARESGRSSSLIVMSPDSPWRFNFLQYEFARPGAGAGLTENLVRLFTTILEVSERHHVQRAAQDFWERTTKQLLRNAVDLLTIAKQKIWLRDLYDIIITAPQSLSSVKDESWRESSVCWKCICEGERRAKNSRQENDFAIAAKYWLSEFPTLSDRTRSIIVTSVTSMLDIFLRGALREMFCTSTNLVPEMTHEGAIVVLDLPVKEFGEVGQLAQVLFKYVWQRATERRDVTRHPLPCFLWADEAQFFADKRDAEFQSTARSSHVATVYLSQNIGAYYSQISESETHSLMGNLQTKIFHANGDPVTNNWAADLFSKSWQFRGSGGTSKSEGAQGRQTVSRNFGSSDSLDYEVLPGEFTRLKKGGPHNSGIVEGVAFQGGRIWRATAKNYIRVAFAQH